MDWCFVEWKLGLSRFGEDAMTEVCDDDGEADRPRSVKSNLIRPRHKTGKIRVVKILHLHNFVLSLLSGLVEGLIDLRQCALEHSILHGLHAWFHIQS